MVLIARWPQSSSFSLLASSISKQNGTAIGRFIVQIRSFRHPEVSAATASTVAAAATLGGGAGSSTGKNMYVVRYQDKSEGYVFIEHLNASSGTEEKGAQMAIDKAEITTTATTPGHSKWTYAVLGPAPSSSDALPNAPTSFPFDHLLQRVLCVAQPTVSAWIQRPSQILIDGYTFNSGDWLIRVGVIQVKGSSVAAKGLVVEVCPFSPPRSIKVRKLIRESHRSPTSPFPPSLPLLHLFATTYSPFSLHQRRKKYS